MADQFVKVAWARYGATGIQLAGSLSRTHLRAPGATFTLCGRKVPRPYRHPVRGSDFSPSTDYVVEQVGDGPCSACEGQAARLREEASR